MMRNHLGARVISHPQMMIRIHSTRRKRMSNRSRRTTKSKDAIYPAMTKVWDPLTQTHHTPVPDVPQRAIRSTIFQRVTRHFSDR